LWASGRERVGETGTANERQGQKKIHSVVQNNTILGFFFLQIVNETTSFCTKCIVSFEQSSAKESPIFKFVFNFLIY
jgi:hypothetical protein